MAKLLKRLGSELTTLSHLTQPVSGTYTQSEQLATIVSGSQALLRDISASLAGLNRSYGDVANAISTYEQRVNQPLNELRRLAGPMERTLVLFEEDLKRHSEAAVDYERKIQGIEAEHERQLREARDEASARKKASEDALETLAWLGLRPTALLSKLVGVEPSSIDDLGQYHASNTIQDLVRSRIEDTVDQGCESVSNLCMLRVACIDTAYQWAQQALSVTARQANDLDVILIPVWYVEWNETADPEQPQQQRAHYRLTSPIQITLSVDETTAAVPMYPAIQQYMQSVSIPGIWQGSFAPDQPVPLAQAVRQSAPLREVLVRVQEGIESAPPASSAKT